MMDSFNHFQADLNEVNLNKHLAQPYLNDFYNVLPFSRDTPDVQVVTRVVNSMIEVINRTKRLPRFLIVMLDKDLISEIDIFSKYAIKTLKENVNWLAKQIGIYLRRKRIDILTKKPGATFVEDSTVIFIRMMRRPDLNLRRGSTKDEIFALRAKFNDTLNEAAARNGFHILTVTACNSYAHYNCIGDLSPIGKTELWQEID